MSCAINSLRGAILVQEIDLTWTPDLNTHTPQQSTDGVNWTPIDDPLPSGTNAYQVTPLLTGKSYWFRLQDTTGGCSNTVGPLKPKIEDSENMKRGVRDLELTVRGQEIDLTWTPNGNAHELQRSTGPGGPWEDIAWLPAGVSGYGDTGVPAGTHVCYRLLACSNTVCAPPAVEDAE